MRQRSRKHQPSLPQNNCRMHKVALKHLTDDELESGREVIDALIGRVVAVEEHPGARAPSYLLQLDLGSKGDRQAQMEPGGYTREDLVGSLVVVSIENDEAIVMCARSHDHGPVLLRPDRDLEPGTVVA